MPFRRYAIGDRAIDAADFNARAQALESLLNSGPARGLAAADGPLPDRAPPRPDAPLVARLTADLSNPGHYAWRAQAWDASLPQGGGWADAGPGDEALGPAIEIQGLDAVAVGDRVPLLQLGAHDGRPALFFAAPRAWIWVRLNASLLLSANRWLYGGTRQRRTLDGFADFAPAMSIQAVAGSAFLNAIEAFNDGAGPEGHGPDVTPASSGGTYPDGFSVRPASRGGPVVQAWRERLPDGSRVWTLQFPNADDGACS